MWLLLIVMISFTHVLTWRCCSVKTAAVQNGSVSTQAVQDHTSDTTAVDGILTSDGDIAAAVTDYDVTVSTRSSSHSIFIVYRDNEPLPATAAPSGETVTPHSRVATEFAAWTPADIATRRWSATGRLFLHIDQCWWQSNRHRL